MILDLFIESDSVVVKAFIYTALVFGIVKIVKFSLSFASILVNLYILPPVNVSISGYMERYLTNKQVHQIWGSETRMGRCNRSI